MSATGTPGHGRDASDPIDFTIDEGDDSEGDEVPDSDLVEEPANDLDHPLWGIDRKGRRFRYMKKSAAARPLTTSRPAEQQQHLSDGDTSLRGVAGPGPSTAAARTNGIAGSSAGNASLNNSSHPFTNAPSTVPTSSDLGTWDNPVPFVLPWERQAPADLPPPTPPRSPSPPLPVSRQPEPAVGSWENPASFVLNPRKHHRSLSPEQRAELDRLIGSQNKKPNYGDAVTSADLPARVPAVFLPTAGGPGDIAPSGQATNAIVNTSRPTYTRPTWATTADLASATTYRNSVDLAIHPPHFTTTEQVVPRQSVARAPVDATPLTFSSRQGQDYEVDDPSIMLLMKRLRSPSPPIVNAQAAVPGISATSFAIAAPVDNANSLPRMAVQPQSFHPVGANAADPATLAGPASSARQKMMSVEIPRPGASPTTVDRAIESTRQTKVETIVIRDDSPDIEMLDDAAAARIAWKTAQAKKPSAMPNNGSSGNAQAGPSRNGLRRSVRERGARPAPTYQVEPADDFFASLNLPSSPHSRAEHDDILDSPGQSPLPVNEESEVEDDLEAPLKYTVRELRDLFERMRSEAQAEAKAAIKPVPPPAGQPGNGASITLDNGEKRTIDRYFPVFTPPPSDDAGPSPGAEAQPDPSSTLTSGVPEEEQPPTDRRGTVIREFDEKVIEDWAQNQEMYADNLTMWRIMFENWIWECADERDTPEIRVINHVDDQGAPPEVEFQYSNHRMYHKDVPDPEYSIGCDCEGGCDPESTTCRCLKIQKLYSYDVDLEGFAYDRDGLLKHAEVPVWECGPRCGCGPECMNRVIQRGRRKTAPIDLFKTRRKGWGVQARDINRGDSSKRYRRDGPVIPRGTFLGIYTGELITEAESERRGTIYEKIGRTYLFDCDGWQIANPPPIYKLHAIDPRLAELAARAAERYRVAQRDREAGDDSSYSAYSVDAFHFGNFTRYFNHSCDPNLAITQAYVTDWNPERPSLVIFTRRDVRPGEELCISYKGLPDIELDPDEEKKRRGKGKKTRKAKTSAAAHAGKESQGRLTHDACHCGAWNCDGRMWKLAQDDESTAQSEGA